MRSKFRGVLGAVMSLALSITGGGVAVVNSPVAGATLPEGKAWNNGYQIGEDQNSMNPGNMPGQVNSAVEVKTDGEESADGTQEWTISWNNYPVLSNQPNQHAWPRSPWLTFALSKNLQIEGNIEWTLESTDAWTRKMGRTVGVQQSVSPNNQIYSGGQFLGIWDNGAAGTKTGSFANGDPSYATDGAILKYLRNGNNVSCLRDNSSPCNATVLETADNNFSDGQKSGPLPFLKSDENSNKFFNSGGYVSAVQLLWTGGTNDYGRAAHVTAKFRTRRDLNTQIVAGNDQTLPNTWVLGGYKSWYLGNPFFQSIHYKYVGAPVEDTDKDGIWDYNEIHVYGTNPNDPDTDDDGLADGNTAVDGLTAGELKAGKDVNNVTRGEDGSIIDSNNYVLESSDPTIGKQLPVVLPATVNTTGDKVTHFTGYVSNIAGNLPGSTQPVPKRYTVEVRYQNKKVASGLTNADGSFDLVAGQALKSKDDSYHNETLGNSYELEDDTVGDATKAVPKMETIQGLESSYPGTNPSDWTIKIWSDGWDGRPIFTKSTEMGWVTEPEPFDNWNASYIDPSTAFATTGTSIKDENGNLVDIKDENVIKVRATLYSTPDSGKATIPFTGAAQYLRMQDTKKWRGVRFVKKNDDGTYKLYDEFYPFEEVDRGVYEAYITSAPHFEGTSNEVDGDSEADFNITYTGGAQLKALAGPSVTADDGTVYPAAESGYFQHINYTWTSNLPDYAAITVDGEPVLLSVSGAATVPVKAVKLTAYLDSNKGADTTNPAGQRYVWVKYPGQDNLVKTLLDKNGSFTYPGSVDITETDKTIKVYNSQDGSETSLIGTHEITTKNAYDPTKSTISFQQGSSPVTTVKAGTGYQVVFTPKDRHGAATNEKVNNKDQVTIVVGDTEKTLKWDAGNKVYVSDEITPETAGTVTAAGKTTTDTQNVPSAILSVVAADPVKEAKPTDVTAVKDAAGNTTISGKSTAADGTKVTVKDKDGKTIAEGKVEDGKIVGTDGNPLVVPGLNPGDTVKVTVGEGDKESPAAEPTVTDGSTPAPTKEAKPTDVTAVKDAAGNTTISGKSTAADGTKVTVKDKDGKTIAEGKVEDGKIVGTDGNPLVVPGLNPGDTVKVTVGEGDKESPAAEPTVTDGSTPAPTKEAKPTDVTAVKDAAGNTTISGKSTAADGTKVTVKDKDGKTIAEGKVEDGKIVGTDGNPLVVPGLNPGDTVKVTVGEGDKESPAAEPTVTDGSTPAPTKEAKPTDVTAVKDAAGNTTISGKSTAADGTKVTVKDKDGKTIAEGKVEDGKIVGTDGNPLVVPGLNPGDTVKVTVGEGANASDAAEVTVVGIPVVDSAVKDPETGEVTITGSVPGAPAGTKVEVINPTTRETVATGTTDEDGKFVVVVEPDKAANLTGIQIRAGEGQSGTTTNSSSIVKITDKESTVNPPAKDNNVFKCVATSASIPGKILGAILGIGLTVGILAWAKDNVVLPDAVGAVMRSVPGLQDLQNMLPQLPPMPGMPDLSFLVPLGIGIGLLGLLAGSYSSCQNAE